ncbi:MAG TPA: SRPBCC domain-containing protein [Verrucomicrobiae bacterium]|jgi:uncharacterized protein YndB with AHSA1/START domain|nr:SRPBCC domain-containing protein [Verrucomicrobiae bacterium]
MKKGTSYLPGPATGAEVEKSGEKWALVMVRELRHAPTRVWQALTDPAQLREWAPYEADRSLATVGPVKLSTVGAPSIDSDSAVKVAEAGKRLEHTWVGNDLKWQLEPLGTGTRLKLWINIDRRFIAWGAAGWHICIDVLDHLLAGDPIGRIAGPEAMKFEGWQRLSGEYGKQFGVQAPSW